MAFELHLEAHQLPLMAASSIFPQQAVQIAGTSVLFALPIATNNIEPFGVNGAASVGASGLNQHEMLTAYRPGNIMKGIAVASLGVNQDIEVAGSGMYQIGQMITASGNWRIGKSLTPAAAGEVFSFTVDPRKA